MPDVDPLDEEPRRLLGARRRDQEQKEQSPRRRLHVRISRRTQCHSADPDQAVNVTTVRNGVYEISDRDVCPIKHGRPGEDIDIKSARLAFDGSGVTSR